MFTVVFQTQGKIPMYEQLYQYIRQEIEQKRLSAGEKLPSKRKLAAHLKISLITVETAYAQLLAEGYIRSAPKQGYFVEPLYLQDWQTEGQTDRQTVGQAPQMERLQAQQKKQETAPTVQAAPTVAYDFRTNRVETEAFPFATWASISRKMLSGQQKALLSNTEPQGLYALRQEIANYLYTCRGIQANPEQMIIGAGSEYLLTLLVTLLGRDKIYGVENPGYHKIPKIFQSNGSCVRPVSLDEQGLQVTELERTGAEVVLVTPSHHFPLGIVMPMQRRLELIAWAEAKKNRYIIEDDYDSEFRFSGRPIQTLQRLTSSQQVIYMSTFAKSLAPSLRIGYLVLPYPLSERFQKELSFYSCTVPSFEQYTLAEFMRQGYYERHVARMRNLYKERRNVLIEALEQSAFWKDCKLQGQKAGLHLLLTVQNGMTEQELVASAERAGVRVYGLSAYYAPDGHGSAGAGGYAGHAGSARHTDQECCAVAKVPEATKATKATEATEATEATVVLGFGGMKNEEIKEAVSRLNSVW